jgi:hypothetical protein
MTSKHLMYLEKHLGTRLLNRNSRSSSLTESGRRFSSDVESFLRRLKSRNQRGDLVNHEGGATNRRRNFDRVWLGLMIARTSLMPDSAVDRQLINCGTVSITALRSLKRLRKSARRNIVAIATDPSLNGQW